LVVEAKSQGRQDLLNAVQTARYSPGVVAISMSWGFGEIRNEANFNAYFKTPPGHAGVTFVAASGDAGAASGVSWPGTSPNVLSFGGTTLYIDQVGNYETEKTWYFSGGGLSRLLAEPSYQSVVQTTGKRSTPDVAFDGDPQTGVQVYSTSPFASAGSWQTVG